MRDKLIDAVVNAISEIERAGGQDAIVGPSRKALPHLAGMEQARAEYARCIRAVLVAIEASGYAVVPKEPTEEMMSKARNSIYDFGLTSSDRVKRIYAAMLSAAPKVTP